VARVYDWYLGGTANWAIDREFGERVLDTFPLLRPIAIANRHGLDAVLAPRGDRSELSGDRVRPAERGRDLGRCRP